MPLDGTLDFETARVFLPLLKPARYKGAHGGRGSAKSTFFADLLVERCMISTGTRGVCVRETQKSLEHSSKQLIEDRIIAHGQSRRFRILDDLIQIREFPGSINLDGHIIFQGMKNHTAESIKSLEGYDVCWMEEAQLISERSLRLLRPTFRKENSEIWASWNPNFPTDPIDKLLRGPMPPPRSKVVRANYRDNPWFPDVLREEMEYDKRRDADHYAHVWMGEYQRNSEARVFKNWRIGEPDEFKTNDITRFYNGADFGFSVDPSVAIRCYVRGRTLYIDREAYRIGCEIQFLPFLFGGTKDAQLATIAENRIAIEDLRARGIEYPGIEDIRKWPLISDTARPDTIRYLQQHGFPLCRAAKKGAGSLEDGIEFMRSYDIVVHPSCIHVIDELTLYSYKIDSLTGEVTRVLENKKNHTIDACRYAVEPLRRAKMGLF